MAHSLKGSRTGTAIAAAASILFIIVILGLHFALNSQSLPRYDGASYQNYYILLSQKLNGVPVKKLVSDLLSGEYFHNCMIPILAFVNQRLGFILSSAVSIGLFNVFVIFAASISVSMLFGGIVLKRVSTISTVIFLLILFSQKIYWSLGNGWWDLRNDLGPALVALASYLAVVLMLLRGRTSAHCLIVFLLGTAYIVSARPPVLVFQGISTVVAVLLVIYRNQAIRRKLIRLTLLLILLVSPILLSLLPRYQKLREYYITNQYEAEQWPLFHDFWTRTVARVYGQPSIYLWLITLILIPLLWTRPKFMRNLSGKDQDLAFRFSLFLLPAFITFSFLNYEGMYGNPFGYILLMISGGAGLALIANFHLNLKRLAIFAGSIVLIGSITQAATDISNRVRDDMPIIQEADAVLEKMHNLVGNDDYSILLLTVAGIDCSAMNILSVEHRILHKVPKKCASLIHSQDFGMDVRLNGRGDVPALLTQLKQVSWLPHAPRASDASDMFYAKHIFVWNLLPNDSDYTYENAYLYSHRVADVFDKELARLGVKQVFTSDRLHSAIYHVVSQL